MIAYMDRQKFLNEMKRNEAERQKALKTKKKGKTEEEDDDDGEDDDDIEHSSHGYSGCASALHRLFQKTLFAAKLKAIDMYNASQKYMHCEIAFFLKEDNEIDVLAFGAASELGVFRKKRTFSNPSYRYIFLETTRAQALEIYHFCDSCVGQQYDIVGVQWSKFWLSLPYEDENGNRTWWCSSFVVCALQRIGLFNTVLPYVIDIDDIISVLERHRLRLTNHATPYELEQATKAFTKMSTRNVVKSEKTAKTNTRGPLSSSSSTKKTKQQKALKYFNFNALEKK